MKKQIYINNELTTYFIEEDGRLFNQKTQHWLKGSVKGGYRVYRINHKNKKYDKLAHRLVAEYFLDNKDNLPIVNHKDGNKLNNHVNNLEWITVQDNNIHAYETGLKRKDNGVKQRKKYNGNLENEIWKTYKNTTFMISNKGRAKNNKTNNLIKGKVTKDGYIEWCFSINGKKQGYLAHRLVFDLFGDEELQTDKVINHKDGIKTNNQIENLEQISLKENVLHSYYVSKTNKIIRQVGKFSLDNELLEVYPSCAEAARQNIGTHSNLISNVCNGKKKTHHGYIWKYIDAE